MKKLDFYPKKGLFNNNDDIVLRVESNFDTELDVEVSVYNLEKIVMKTDLKLFFTDGIAEMNLGTFDNNRSYVVEIKLDSSSFISSFEVYDDFKSVPRYGFLSDFTEFNINNNNYLKTMLKLHINVVQYYDWMYQHNDLVSKTDNFVDLMGRNLNQKTVKNRIEMLKEHGIKNIAYGAIYGASNEFYDNHKEWAFYTKDNEAIRFIDVFTIMNFAEESPWHSHIINEYRKAIELMGFDGIHMDTYGYPKIANDYEGNTIYLEEHFNKLINNTKSHLESKGLSSELIFNNVGSWPVNTTHEANQSALYIEVWDPISTYNDLMYLINQVKSFKSGKELIISAYLKPYYNDSKAENIIAHKLLASVLYASGAHHLIMGENQKVLRTGYYCDYGTLDDNQFEEIRKYYDFNSAYSQILYDNSLKDVSLTHTKGDNEEYIIQGVNSNPLANKDSLLTIIKENKSYKVIHLINLIGQENLLWNKEKNTPTKVENIQIEVQVEKEVNGVYISSPDKDIKMQELKYEIVKKRNSSSILFNIDQIELWSMIYIKLK